MRFSSPFRPATRLETATQTHTDMPGEADQEDRSVTEAAPVFLARSHVLRHRLCKVWLGSGVAAFCVLTAFQCALTNQIEGFYGAAFFASCTAYLVIWVRQALSQIYERDNSNHLRFRQMDSELIEAEMENAIIRRENSAMLASLLTMYHMNRIADVVAEECADAEAKIISFDWKH